jgi:DUF1680 family protein
LERGPILYCAEWPDNNGSTGNILLPEQASFSSTFRPLLLNGVVTLEADLPAVLVDKTGLIVSTEKRRFTAIPYYSWANRGKGEMNVWFPSKIKEVDLISKN